MNRGTEKQVNLKETFEEAAAREWRENHPEHENYQQRMPHQSPIVAGSLRLECRSIQRYHEHGHR